MSVLKKKDSVEKNTLKCVCKYCRISQFRPPTGVSSFQCMFVALIIFYFLFLVICLSFTHTYCMYTHYIVLSPLFIYFYNFFLVPDDTIYLFVVNHPQHKSQVELFQFVEDNLSLVHLQTIKHELLHRYSVVTDLNCT